MLANLYILEKHGIFNYRLSYQDDEHRQLTLPENKEDIQPSPKIGFLHSSSLSNTVDILKIVQSIKNISFVANMK